MFALLVLPFAFGCKSDSEDALISQINSNSIEITPECIQYTIDSSWYEAGNLLVSLAIERDIPLDQSLKTQALSFKKKLEKFIAALDNSANAQIVSPAYQWAQSPSMIYLDVKFSHRLDSPGCLEVKNPLVTITDTKVSFSANCAQTAQRIKLELEIDLFADINREESDYSFTSVGRLNINLKKKEEAAWPKPMKGKKPGNTHTWWEMKEKYQSVMNKFVGEEEEQSESQFKKSPEGLTTPDENTDL